MVPRLYPGQTAVLVVDVQEKLVPAMHESAALIAQVGRLLDGAAVLSLPVLVTEQYRKGLGVTVPEIGKRLEKAVCNHEKLRFSACIDPVRAELSSRGIRSVVVCGIETHVCVVQTCLELLDAGYATALAWDATTSRRPGDRDAALARMTQAGVLPTTVESALFELMKEAGTPAFKAMLPVVK